MISPCPYICNNKTEYGYCKTGACINPKRQSQMTTYGYSVSTFSDFYDDNGHLLNNSISETESIKHGKWNTVVNSNNHITYYCPICGSIFNKGCADLGDYNYCPNCGAKMDLDEVKNG